MAVADPVPGYHPVLIESTRTFLVWLQADSPEQACKHAEANAQELLCAPLALPVDASIEVAALSEDAAAWLDLGGEQYARIDRYFSDTRTGGAR